MTANKKTNNVDTTKEFTAIEWCAGYGGIHLGLKRAIPNLRVIAYGEIEAFAAANLVAKMEAGLLDPAPLWTDIKTFPCEDFRDRVGLLVAGYPCQPFSAAGKRLGAEDPRHLWPHIARAIGIIRPRLCFFENVEGHISLGLREVIGELESIGYQTAWGIFSASEVGAPHQRKRVFILAVSNSLRGAAGLSRSLAWNEGIAGEFDHGSGEGGGVAITLKQGLQGRSSESLHSRRLQCEAGRSGDIAWPSRPGEPQHAWEPPRVVANNNRPHAGHGEQRPERTFGDLSGGCGEGRGKLGDSTHQRDFHQTQQDNAEAGADFDRTGEGERVAHAGSLGRRGRSDGDEGGMCREIQTSGSCGCSAEAGMAHAHGGRGEEPEHQQANLPSEPSGCCAEAMGNSTSPRRSRPEDTGADRGDESQGPWREESERAGTMGNTHSPRPQERKGQRGAGIQGTHADGGAGAERQAQPPMGRDTHGATGGMDYAELCVSCDNRTDELRLLGNGVVPATAERAFRILMEEIISA